MTDDENINLDRRNFFRLGIHKAAKAVVDVTQATVMQRPSRYIRPPFAIDEIEFLEKCTRCHKCIEACPHQTIFRLADRLGNEIATTPALDLTNGACHLCQDWPCVAACETEALKLPEEETPENEFKDEQKLPRLADVFINPEICLPFMGPECGVCGSVCPVPGAIIWDMSKPHINMDTCTGCAMCRQSCITEPKAITISSIKHSLKSE